MCVCVGVWEREREIEREKECFISRILYAVINFSYFMNHNSNKSKRKIEKVRKGRWKNEGKKERDTDREWYRDSEWETDIERRKLEKRKNKKIFA